eukprot:TRINITY_DN371_c0_g1_i2.p1 TRINITY_DN371_c0_g1~~TRINITY_DN371_c0_g1_i2.p1  ORF type:complete len:149 (+),score=59.38 TRINITY_DN371_c0_g1_i2:62-508(+)
MPPKKDAKKDAKSSKAPAKASNKSGGKAKKKKWSKGKVREKLSNLVLFDKATYEKLLAEVPSYKLITPSIVSERLKINGSLARRAIKELLNKNLIKCVSHHHNQLVYTRATAAKVEAVTDPKAAAAAKKGGKAAPAKKAAPAATADAE